MWNIFYMVLWCSNVLDWHITWKNEWLPSTDKVLPNKAQDEMPTQKWSFDKNSLHFVQTVWFMGIKNIDSYFFSSFFLFYIGAQMIKNAVIISNEQQRDSAIHIYLSILPRTPLPSRLPYNIEQSSLCYTRGPCWLSILNIAVYRCLSQIPWLSLPQILHSGNHKLVLYVWVCFCLVHLFHFLASMYKGYHMIF